MKLTGSIVNGNLMLIGFKVEAKKSEVDAEAAKNKDNSKVEARMTIQDLIDRRVRTSTVDFSSGKLVLLGGFKLYDLPMEIFMGENEGFRSINNEIEAVGRVVKDGKDVGYKLKAEGLEVALPTEKIDAVIELMKPKNFVVRHDESGKAFVAAKRGAIAELPIIADLSNKANRSSNIRKARPVNTSDYTFEDILTYVASCNGLIAYIPGVEYIKKTDKVTGSGIDEIKAGQLASPYAVPTISNANLNLKFKGLGSVKIETAAGEKTLYPQMFREKIVYEGKKNKLKIVGLLLDKKYEQQAVEQFLGIGAEIVTNEKLLEFYARIIGRTPGSITVIKINIDNVRPYRDSEVIDLVKLAFAINAYEQVEATYKKCSKLEKDFIKKHGAKYQKISESLKGLSDDEIEAAKLAGINIADFSFTRTIRESSETESEETKAAKSISMKWSVELSEAAEVKRTADIEQLVDECIKFVDAEDADGLRAAVDKMRTGAAELKKTIWEANKSALRSEGACTLRANDGITPVETTSAKMTSSKRIEFNGLDTKYFTGMKLEIKNAGNLAIVIK